MKFLIAFLALVCGARAADWDYDDNGADWSGACATGIQQSPVDITTATAVRFTFEVDVHERDTEDSGTVANNGHTLVYTPDTIGAVTVRNPMDGDAEYTLAQFHFHWDDAGGRVSIGSEHTVDGQAYPLEAHFVHYRTIYGDLAEAVNHDDGLMVVGQFFRIDENASNAELDMILDAAENVVAKGAEFHLNATLSVLPLMTDNADVFTYDGSLTTPTCNEIVRWFVLRTPMGVPLAQLQKLWALEKDNTTATIMHNWRPVQPLNGRTVHRSFAYTDEQNDDTGDDHDGHDSHGSASSLRVDSLTLVALALVSLVGPFFWNLA